MFEPSRITVEFSDDQNAAWDAATERLAANGVDLIGGEIDRLEDGPTKPTLLL